jgi:integrase
MHAVIRRALNVAVRWQLIAVNPATLVDAPKAAQHEITPLTAAEARRLIQAAEGDRMQARWLVGLALGLRQGEALGLSWEDVDLERTIPLPGQLAAALQDHRDRQAKERAAAGSLWQASECVFTTPIGTPVDPRNDFREFRKLLARAGLPPVRLHDLRHTAASLLLAQHVPARVVMEILGHSQISLTMNTYSHVAPEVSREAADRMARALWHDEDQADDDAAGERTDG